jgi:hypothetical protein
MTDGATRRTVLATASAATVAALAGCSGLSAGETETDPAGDTGTAPSSDTGTVPSSDARRATPDQGPSPARDWLYDPGQYAEQTSYSLQFHAPAELTADAEHLHPEVPDDVPGIRYDGTMAPEATDWSVRASDPLFRGPMVFACGGSFDEEVAEANAGLLDGGGRDGTAAGTVGDYEVRTYGDQAAGAFTDGQVVSATAIDEAGFKSLLERRIDGDPGVGDAVDGAGTFLSELGFPTATVAGLSRSEDGSWNGKGVAYAVDGAETRVRLVELRQRSAERLRDLGDEVDGVTDVEAGETREVAWVAGTAPTGRLAFNATEFDGGRLPYADPDG